MTVAQIIGGYSDRMKLYHYTDINNLSSIAHFNALYSCQKVNQELSNTRRSTSVSIQYNGQTFIANDQLYIPDDMFARGVTSHSFYSYLDRHVFFWPTKEECRKMFNSYVRRMPRKIPVIFEFDAQSLLSYNYDKVKLCKYNSGSRPLNPHNCGYRKGPHIFIPASQLGTNLSSDVPRRAKDIREILVETEVTNLDSYLKAIYCDDSTLIPPQWRHYHQHISTF